MNIRPLVTASVVGATLLVSACNDDHTPRTLTPRNPGTPSVPAPTPSPTPSPMAKTITEFVASLIAMVSGSACDTALPTDVNGQNLTDDTTSVDANAQSVNCTT